MDTLNGNGVLSADGGGGGGDFHKSGNGSGGRISVEYQTANNWTGNSLTAAVATEAGTGGENGSVGTVNIALSARYTITGTSGIAIADPSTGDDALSGGVLSNTNIDLRLTEGGEVVADLPTILTSNRDWAGVTADTDVSSKKAFFHFDDSAGSNTCAPSCTFDDIPGTFGTEFVLYIPKVGSDNGVHICPGASSLGAVTTSCASGYDLTAAAANVSIVTIDSSDYWRVTGLTSTGGLGTFVNATTFTLTPNTDGASETQEINMTYVASGEFVNLDQIVITFESGAGLTLADCSTAEVDADNDATGDGSVGIASNVYTYTFTGSTTLASTTGIDLCVDVTAYSTQGNYSVTLNDDNAGFGAALYYVGGDVVSCGGNNYTLDGDNDVVVCSQVLPTLSFNIRDLGDTTDTNVCALGALTTATTPNTDGTDDGVGECGYSLAVGTNSSSGFQVQINAGTTLDTAGGDTIADAAEDDSIAAGVEAYGLVHITSAQTGRDDSIGSIRMIRQ